MLKNEKKKRPYPLPQSERSYIETKTVDDRQGFPPHFRMGYVRNEMKCRGEADPEVENGCVCRNTVIGKCLAGSWLSWVLIVDGGRVGGVDFICVWLSHMIQRADVSQQDLHTCT
jgi:hypothetical protein